MPADRTFPTKADAGRSLPRYRPTWAGVSSSTRERARSRSAQWSEEWLALPKRVATIAEIARGSRCSSLASGSLPLSAITPKHVQAAVNARAKGAAPATLRRDFAALRAVLNARGGR